MVLFSDALTLDAPRRTSDGYMAVRAKAARTGTYAYLGSEIDPENRHGLRDAGMVNVLRDAAAVFDPLSAHSFIGKPITDNHPTVAVNAKNWRDHARGTVMGAKWEEGGYLAFDLMLTDADTIDAVDAGKRELSNGYAAELQFGDFDGPGGVKCVAKQIAIKGNHVAIVDRGRAGPSCAITDSVAICDANPAAVSAFTQEKQVKKIVLDGLQVDLSDAEAVSAAISKLQDKAAQAETALTDAKGQISTLQGEKAVLEKKLADANAELTPAKQDQRVADRAALVTKAKLVKADIVTDGKTDAEIRRAVVAFTLGDAEASALDDVGIAGAFAMAAKDAKPADPLRTIITDGLRGPVNDAATVATIRAARYA
ncbi:DUF2213 domain-containing protein [Sphingobium sp.]|jgi:hypothetical protein|uniref:DUF2213 domain-containing protein n=1 Tax=Sphingobium sp. TaxID=1912891 RepID=UPI00257E111D|nr:DUF2213 domain-containing protein [Sphingobium sp.]